MNAPQPPTKTAPVEAKVTASSIAATLSSLVLTELTMSLGTPLPGWVGMIVTGVVTGAVTFASGWLAKHTPRAPQS